MCGAGYQANNISDIPAKSGPEVQALEAIANLVTSGVDNRDTIYRLTLTNTSLTESVAQLVKEVSNLRKELAAAKKIYEPSSKRKPYYHYCWSCRYNCNYLSSKCLIRKEDYEPATTFHIKIGGTERKATNS